MALSPIDLERFVEPELWSGYWQKLRQIEQMLFASQADAELIKEQITAGLTAQP